MFPRVGHSPYFFFLKSEEELKTTTAFSRNCRWRERQKKKEKIGGEKRIGDEGSRSERDAEKDRDRGRKRAGEVI